MNFFGTTNLITSARFFVSTGHLNCFYSASKLFRALGNSTGVYCSESAHVSLISRRYALSLEEVVGIILSLFIIVLIVALFVFCRRVSAKRRRQHHGAAAGANGTMNLIQNQFERDLTGRKKQQGGRNKNGSAVQKLNNYDLSAREQHQHQELPLLLNQRPSSISPSMNEDETPFTYPETVRSYGLAGDELEATLPHRLPQDFIQNIQKPVATVAPSMMADRDMNLKDNYFLMRKKSSPGRDSTRPSSSSSLLYRAVKLRVNLPPQGVGAGGGHTADEDTCHSELSMEDDCQRYHWDCSDWAHTTASPALFELPNGAVIDSPSWMSETPQNGSGGNLGASGLVLRRPGGGAMMVAPLELPGAAGPVDPTRDFETLAEDDMDDEAGGQREPRRQSLEDDSECESQLGAVYPDDEVTTSPMHQTNKSIEELMMINGVNYADDEDDDLDGLNNDIPNSYDYHINHYLPTYHLGSDPDTQDEATPMLGRHPFTARGATLVSPPIRSPDGLMSKYSFYKPPQFSPQPAASSGLYLAGGLRAATAGQVGSSSGLLTRLPPPAVRPAASEDQLCELEDSGDEVDDSKESEVVQRIAASPRVTQV